MPRALPNRPVPNWLQNITNLDSLPIKDVLKDSVYYPACDVDGSIIQEFNGYSHSFIYVDYETAKDRVNLHLNRFGGYDVLMKREVTKEELCFAPFTPIYPLPSDGNPLYKTEKNAVELFAIWVILERQESTDVNHGAKRFSLLFIKGEGFATYQALYYSNQVAPSIVVAKGTSMGFGGNWTDFFKTGGFYERTVLSNPYGKPQYLCARDDVHWNEFTIPIYRHQKRRTGWRFNGYPPSFYFYTQEKFSYHLLWQREES